MNMPEVFCKILAIDWAKERRARGREVLLLLGLGHLLQLQARAAVHRELQEQAELRAAVEMVKAPQVRRRREEAAVHLHPLDPDLRAGVQMAMEPKDQRAREETERRDLLHPEG